MRAGQTEQIQGKGDSLPLSENSVLELLHRLEELARVQGFREGPTVYKIPPGTQREIDGKAEDDEVVKHDGTVALSADWDIGDGRKIEADQVAARDAAGLKLTDDGGNGAFVEDGGHVGFLTTEPTAAADINSDILRLRTAQTPESASDDGNQGDICWDSSYIYICVATNTWKRAAISTW